MERVGENCPYLKSVWKPDSVTYPYISGQTESLGQPLLEESLGKYFKLDTIAQNKVTVVRKNGCQIGH